MEDIRYATLTVVRNEEKIIEQALDRVINQTIKPRYIIVVNDGSRDKTLEVLKKIKEKVKQNLGRDILFIVNRRDRGFSALGTVLMADVYNAGFRVLMKYNDWDYVIIVSADTLLPLDFVQRIIPRMDGYGVASGIAKDNSSHERLNPKAPAGSSKVIRRSIIEGLGGGYPRTFNWEGSSVRYSWYKGLKTGHFSDIVFDRVRAGGQGHRRNYIGWGRGMKDGGYHPLMVVMRSLKLIILRREFNKAIRLFVGYMGQPSLKNPPAYAKKTREIQKQRIIIYVKKLLKKTRLY